MSQTKNIVLISKCVHFTDSKLGINLITIKTYNLEIKDEEDKSSCLSFFPKKNLAIKNKELSICPIVLIFYCCVITHHKLSDL